LQHQSVKNPTVALKEYKPEKLLYSMGEVTEMFDVKPSLIRFWEQRFDILKPKKNKKGNRLFTPADVKNLEIIYHLTKERGMTLAGVEKYLKNNRENAERETEIVRRLQTIRSLLMEIREELREDDPRGTTILIAEEVSDIPEQTSTREEPAAELPNPDEFTEEILPGEVVEEIPGEEIWEEEVPADGEEPIDREEPVEDTAVHEPSPGFKPEAWAVDAEETAVERDEEPEAWEGFTDEAESSGFGQQETDFPDNDPTPEDDDTSPLFYEYNPESDDSGSHIDSQIETTAGRTGILGDTDSTEALETDPADGLTAPDEITEAIDTESFEPVDAEVTEPFTVQPLFDLEDAPESIPAGEPEAEEPEPMPAPSAVDTQQSLF